MSSNTLLQQSGLTPRELKTALDSKPRGGAAQQLADRIRQWFGADLTKGPNPKVSGVDVAWAFEAPGLSRPPTLKVDPSITNLVGSALHIRRIGKGSCG